MTDVSRKVWGDHDDIIEVDEQGLPVEATENMLHKSLKGNRGESQTEQQHLLISKARPAL